MTRLDVSEAYFEDDRHAPSDVSGKRSQTYVPSGLDDVTAVFDDLLLLPDHGAVAMRRSLASWRTMQMAMPIWPPPGRPSRLRGVRRWSTTILRCSA